MFCGCTKLRRVVLDGEQETIPEDTFRGCSALETVQLPNHLSRIGANAFAACTSLRTITIPDAETIGKRAFAESGLEEVQIGAVDCIPEECFISCTSAGD